MRVNGYAIMPEVIERAKAWCLTQTEFRSGGLMAELARLGVPEQTSYRAADRLITKWKKSGEIRMKRHGYWERCP